MVNKVIKSSPLVSIIVPLFNMEQSIGLCIQSVLKQTYPYWELLIMDDGSSDGSIQTVNEFKDERIRVFSDGQNKGCAHRLNEGIANSKGTLIARLDADDAMFPERLMKQVAYFVEYPKTDVLGTWAVAFDYDSVLTGKICLPLPTSYHQLVATGSCFIHPSVMARADWFRSNLYNASFKRVEDFELWVRTFHHSNYSIISEPLVFYRNTGVMEKWKYELARAELNSLLLIHKDKIKMMSKVEALSRTFLRVSFYHFFKKIGLLNRFDKLTIDESEKFKVILQSIKK